MNERDERRAAEELDAFLTARQAGHQVQPPASTPWSATLADLAADMQPDPDFVATLEARLSRQGRAATHPFLLTHWQKFISKIRRQTMYKRLVFTLGGAAALVLLSLLGPSLLSGWRQGPTPVSAAEILERANATLAAQADGADVIYDRLELDWQGISPQRDVLAELWQSADGAQFRYQLTSAEGDLLYFIQRDGERVWRSVHGRPVGDVPVTRVYETSLEQYQAQLAPTLAAWSVFHGDLSTSWATLDRLIVQRRQACSDLYCLLGGPELAWKCDGQVCTPSNIVVPAEQAQANGVIMPFVQARLSGEEKLDDGRTVYVVELVMPSNWTRTLRIDKQSFALVEIVERERNNFIASLRHLERQTLSNAQASDVFGALPQDLEVVPVDQTGQGEDRLWIISVSPEPGTELQSSTRFEVVVGYKLVSSPEAQLLLKLDRSDAESSPPPVGHTSAIPGAGWVNIQASNEQVTVPFTVRLGDEQWSAPGNFTLQVTMYVWEGAHTLKALAKETFVEYQWYKP